MKVKELFESQFDTLSTSLGLFYFYKNPTSKEFYDKDKRDMNTKGIIDSDGNLYIVYFWFHDPERAYYDGAFGSPSLMMHCDFIEFLQRRHGLFTAFNSFYANRYPEQIILVQNRRGTNDFYLSEIYSGSELKNIEIQKILVKAKRKNPSLKFFKKRITDVL